VSAASPPVPSDPKSAPAASTLPFPRVLGRYEVVGLLGRGGMATVYLARSAGEAGFSRLFAVKVLHPHLADEEGFVGMLHDEGKIAARLHHPNVVPIVDIGSQGDLHYVVMEYIEGCSLHALLAKNRDNRPPRLIVPVVLDALAGLHAAHTLTDDDGKPMNLVHRDVSPQNILLGIDGTAHVTDFGVARAESRITSTQPGQLKGKIAYMSPEQLRTGIVDRRSDVFSAGCLLWMALTGRRLFLGSTDVETMSNILGAVVPPPSTIGLQPPEAFDAICLKALERDAQKRWTSAAEMEEALREAAMKDGALGSRRELAEWVASAFGEELSARRAAVRAAASRPDRVSLSDSHPTTSGLRQIPGVGEDVSDVDVNLEDSRSSRRAQISARTQQVLGASGADRTRLFVGAGIALVLGVAGTWFALRSSPAAAPVASASAGAPVATATPPAQAAAPPTAASPAAVPAAPPAPVAQPALVMHAAAPPPAVPAQAVARPTYPAWHPPAARKPPAIEPPAPPPPATNAAPKPTTWDKDSPLPPQ